MHVHLHCRCGQMEGEVDLAAAHARATCYCQDCQAFARFLGHPGTMDAAGGTDIVAMAPSGVRFTAGADQLACMSMSPNGLLRWYASCCRTPLANTPREPKVFYTGLVTACLQAALPELESALGPPGRLVVNAGSATAPVKAARWRFLLGGLQIFGPLVAARLRGRRAGAPFFDDQGRPVRAPVVITRGQRAALRQGTS